MTSNGAVSARNYWNQSWHEYCNKERIEQSGALTKGQVMKVLTVILTIALTLTVLVLKDYVQQSIDYKICTNGNSHSLMNALSEDMLLCPLSEPSIADSIDAVLL